MLTRPVVVAQTHQFSRSATRVWTDEELEAFVDFIALNADLGDVIPGLGGIRKVRWSREGTGKRGGTRVIYFFYNEDTPIYLLKVYAKGEKADLNAEEKKALRRAADTLKADATRGKS